MSLHHPVTPKDPGEAKPRTAEESFDHGSLVDADATNVSDPRLAHLHPVHPGVPAQNRNASSDSPGHTEDDCHVHLTHDITEVPNAALRASHDQKNAVNNNNTPTTKAASNTIRDFLAKNAAFQPQPGDAVEPRYG